MSEIIETGVVKHTVNRFIWSNTHKKYGCRKFCRDEKEHFYVWREAYTKYIEELYGIFSRGISPCSVKFEDFEEFAFSQSSGYMARHA